MGPTQQWLRPKKAVMSHEDNCAKGLKKLLSGWTGSPQERMGEGGTGKR